MHKPLQAGCREDGASGCSSSGAQGQDQRSWAQTGTQEVPFEHQETLFHCEGDGALAQVAQGGCGVSILGDTQKPSGHGLGQQTLGGPA